MWDLWPQTALAALNQRRFFCRSMFTSNMASAQLDVLNTALWTTCRLAEVSTTFLLLFLLSITSGRMRNCYHPNVLSVPQVIGSFSLTEYHWKHEVIKGNKTLKIFPFFKFMFYSSKLSHFGELGRIPHFSHSSFFPTFLSPPFLL